MIARPTVVNHSIIQEYDTMATKKNAGANKAAKGNDKAIAKTTSSSDTHRDQLPVGINMEQHAGAGLENADRDSFAIPFLAIMQKGSPQVDKDSDEFVDGAEVGDLMLTTSGDLFKDEDGVDLIFCGYRRVFLRWATQDDGGGFKGELTVDEVTRGRATGEFVEQDNKLFANNGDVIRDTRIHYVLVLRGDGTAVPAVLSVSSTQIKKSKMLLTQIQSYIAKDSQGKAFNPPTFGHIFHAETIAESNDKGSWRGWKFSRTGFVSDAGMFNTAREFHETVKGETVKVDYRNDGSVAADDADGRI